VLRDLGLGLSRILNMSMQSPGGDDGTGRCSYIAGTNVSRLTLANSWSLILQSPRNPCYSYGRMKIELATQLQSPGGNDGTGRCSYIAGYQRQSPHLCNSSWSLILQSPRNPCYSYGGMKSQSSAGTSDIHRASTVPRIDEKPGS
jgi:hypothetical protein